MPKVNKKKTGTVKKFSRKPQVKENYIPSEKDNDVSWYTRYPSLVKAQSSLIFNTRYGHNYDVLSGVTLKAGFTRTNYNSIPGCVTFNFRFTVAGDGTESDAFNVCSKNLYTYIRHANSGAANYESSDLMQYVLSVLGLTTMLEQAKRDLRLVYTFNPLNRYVHKAALRARGYSLTEIDNMIANSAQYVGRINNLVAQINTFKIPKDFPIFDKFEWLVTNLFKDDDLDKATYYMYQTRDRVHYDWANRVVDFTNTPTTTFANYLDAIQLEINNLLNYEDIGIMIGDILKAYKQEGCRVWAPMQLGEIQDATKSDEVLRQIENNTWYSFNDVLHVKQINANTQLLGLYQGTSTTPGVIDVTIGSGSETAGIITSNTAFSPILVMHDNEVTADDILTSTRNTNSFVAGYTSSGKPNYGKMTHYTTNVLTDCSVTYFDPSGVLFTEILTHSFLIFSSMDITTMYTWVKFSHIISKFPTLYLTQEDSNAIHTRIYMHGKNNQTVDKAWLDRLHDACRMSELSLPMFKLLESN